jgi:hypothetical protein
MILGGGVSAIVRPYARYQILTKLNYNDKEESSHRR